MTPGALLHRGCCLDIESRIHKVNILRVQLFPQELHGFAETLEVNDLPFTQEFDHIVNIRIIGQPQDVVIGDPGLLFCCYLI